MKRFTNSATFDVDFLLNKEASRKAEKRERHFDKEAVYDVKNLFEK